jgi:carboxymethylenebutenolidase
MISFTLLIFARSAATWQPDVRPSETNAVGSHLKRVTTTFESHTQSIRIDAFRPKSGGRHPIVIALHGSGAFAHVQYNDFAQMLADRGFAVFVPHYFDATGTTWASPQEIREHHRRWFAVISEAIDFAAKQDFADPEAIGIVGFSLGAYLGLGLAATQPRIRAVVDYYGGMPDEVLAELQHCPAVLILHGDRDQTVPVAEAYKLESLLKSREVPHEMKIYPGAAHGFRGIDMLDAAQRTYFFLKQHLHDSQNFAGPSVV